MAMPPVDHLRHWSRDRIGKSFNVSAMEERLCNVPVPQPEFTVGREQAVPEEELEPLVKPAPNIVRGVCLQDVLDMVRVRESVRNEWSEAVSNDVSILE